MDDPRRDGDEGGRLGGQLRFDQPRPATAAPPAVVRSRRHPHQLLLLAFSLVGALSGLLLAPSTVVSASFGGGQFAWYGGLGVSALVALIGLVRSGVDGLLIERTGLVCLGGVCMAYAVAAVWLTGTRGVFPGLLVGACGVATLVRAGQISNDLRRLHQTRGEWRENA